METAQEPIPDAPKDLRVTGASMRRHVSRQDYETPGEFVQAVENRFGKLSWDLAATATNAKAAFFLTLKENSLIANWSALQGLLWLNPPFSHIELWAAKCRWEAKRGAKILLLTPASIGSEWFANHIHGHALVLALRPRLTFDGIAPYPKDCMLSVFWAGIHGFDTWKWK